MKKAFVTLFFLMLLLSGCLRQGNSYVKEGEHRTAENFEKANDFISSTFYAGSVLDIVFMNFSYLPSDFVIMKIKVDNESGTRSEVLVDNENGTTRSFPLPVVLRKNRVIRVRTTGLSNCGPAGTPFNKEVTLILEDPNGIYLPDKREVIKGVCG